MGRGDEHGGKEIYSHNVVPFMSFIVNDGLTTQPNQQIYIGSGFLYPEVYTVFEN